MVTDTADRSDGGRRVAIVRRGDAVAPHIARADGFAVYDCADGTAERGPDLEMPAVSVGFLLAFLQGHRVDAEFAGNTGGGLRALFELNGIEVVRSIAGIIEDAARACAAGELGPADLPCTGCGDCR